MKTCYTIKKIDFFLLLLLCFFFNNSFAAGTTYYSKASGIDPSDPNSWTVNSNGTGATPTNFTTSGDVFILQLGHTLTMTTVAGAKNWIIASGVTLQIDGKLGLSGAVGITTVTINGTVVFTDQSASQVTTNGLLSGNSFTLGSGATLITANQNGIYGSNCSISNTTGGANNLTVNLNNSATYEFNGTSSQVTLGLPSGTSSTILIINNTAGVTLSAAVTLFSLTIGNVTANSIFSDGGNQVTCTGTLNLTSGTYKLGAGTATTFPGFGTRNISSGTTVEYAAGTSQTVSTTPSYENLVFSGSGTKTIASGTLSIAKNWTVGSTTAANTNNPTINLTGNFNLNSGTFTSTSGTFSTGGTWSNNSTFADNSGTVTLNGSSQQAIGGSSSTTFYNLTISNSSGALLATNQTINNTLSLTGGNLDLSTKILTIGPVAPAISGTFSSSRMIIADGGGEIRKSATSNATASYTFPIGDNTGTAEYTPITLSITGSGYASAYVGASLSDAKHVNNANTTNYLTRYWKVTQSGISSCVANVTGTYINSASDVTGTLGSIKAAQLNGIFNQTTNPWIKTGGSVLSGTTLTYTGATITAGQTSFFTGITDPTVSITGGNVTTCYQSNVNLGSSVTGGDTPFLYSWSPATFLSSTTIANPVVTNPTATTSYTVTITDGNGIQASASSTITVQSVPTVGSIGTAQTICYNTVPFGLTNTSSGTGDGTITYRWESNTNLTTPSWSTVSGQTASTYSPGALTMTTQYRRITISMLNSVACESAATATVQITVQSVPAAGSIGTAQTICYNTAPSGLTNTSSGTGDGTITYRWESNTNLITPSWSTISGQTATSYSPGALTTTTQYRRITISTLNSVACESAATTTVQITVQSVPAAGSIGTAQTICYNTVPSGLTNTSSGTGDGTITYRWESNTNLTTPSWSTVSGQTASTYSPGALTTTTQYRRITISTLNSVACESAATATVQITVQSVPAAGSIGTDQTICYNTVPTGLTNTSSGTGDGTITYRWESNTNLITPSWSTVSGQTASAYSPGALTTTTQYRRITISTLNSVACESAATTAVQITVQSVPTAGSIGMAQTICYNTVPSGLTNPSSGTGDGTITYRWESNTNLVTPSSSTVSGQTASVYSPGALTTTTQYRRITISTLNSVACESTATATVQITVQSVPAVGSIGAAQTICYNTVPSGLTNTSSGTGDGTITYRWESNTNLVTPSWSAISGQTASAYSPGALTATTQYRRITISTLNGVACESTATSTVQITVTPNNTVGAASSSPALCINTALTDITHTTTGATGIGAATSLPAGVTAAWSANTITISGTPTASGTFNYSIPLTGGCGSVNATGTITVNTAPATPGTITQPAYACASSAGNTFNIGLVAGATSYTWSVTGTGWAITGGGSTISATITIGSEDGTVSVTATNGCGTSAAASTGTISPTSPATPIAAILTQPSCTVATGSITLDNIPTGCTINPGAIPSSGSTITISGLTPGPYTYTVTSNSTGCTSLPSNSVTINTVPTTLPTPTIGAVTQPTPAVMTGSFTIAYYDSSYTYTVNPSAGTTRSGDTITVTNADTYTVTATSGTCTSTASANVVIINNYKIWNASKNTTEWFDDANWTPTGIPTTTSDVYIGVKPYYPSINQTANCNTLTINGGALEIQPIGTLNVTDKITVDSAGTFNLLSGASLVQVNNTANDGIINVYRDSAKIILNDYTYWSSPTWGTQTLLNFSPYTLPKYFLAYSNGWTYLNASTNTFTPGTGYSILAPNGTDSAAAASQTFQFIGTPNNGDVSVHVDKSATLSFSSKLIGNPYPCAIDANEFIDANTYNSQTGTGTISGTLYFWTHNNAYANGTYTSNDYATYTKLGGTSSSPANLGHANTLEPQKFIASCQGFVVQTVKTGNVIFTNAMRTGGGTIVNSTSANGTSYNGNFYKNANEVTSNKTSEKNRIWLNFINNSGANFSQTLLGYIDTATNNYDPGLDGTYNSSGKTGMYSLIGNSKYAIQAKAFPFLTSDIVPLGYTTDIKGNSTISVDSVDGLFANGQDIFVEDKLLNVIHKLNGSPYTFSTEAGTFNSRFVLRYTATNDLGLNELEDVSNNLVISSQNQTIKIKSETESINKVFVYDVLGREIYQNVKVGANETSISDLRDQQIIIVKVVLANGKSISKKVIY